MNSTDKLLSPYEMDEISQKLTANIQKHEIQKYENGSMAMDLTFFDPLLISRNLDAYDKVVIIVKNQTQFVNSQNVTLSTYMMERSITR